MTSEDLKRALEDLNLSQAELGRELGLHDRSVRRQVSGEVPVQGYVADAILQRQIIARYREHLNVTKRALAKVVMAAGDHIFKDPETVAMLASVDPSLMQHCPPTPRSVGPILPEGVKWEEMQRAVEVMQAFIETNQLNGEQTNGP